MRTTLIIILVTLALNTASGQEPTPAPGPIREEVTVTASRVETQIADTPTSVTIISRDDIQLSAAPAIDDVLRRSVGFSIFRRSSSRNANPTTQGVSLRGVGASGASRTAVLFDDVPLNDPFGGWIQWNRVSNIAVERVEILRGGASSLYGDTSLSGAVNIIPRDVRDKWLFSADVFGGTQRSLSGSAFAGFKTGRWTGDVTAAKYQTRGFKPVDEAERGSADVFAGVRSSTFSGRLVREFGERVSVFLRPNYFGEVRTNGTGLQTNRTHIKQLATGGEVLIPENNIAITWRGFGGDQVYDQVFSAINTTRSGESLTRLQRVPSQYLGGSIQLSAALGQHTLVGGAEARNVRGVSNEIAVMNDVRTALVDSGGREVFGGVFVQDLVRAGERMFIVGGVRYDRWRNYDASSVTQSLVTGSTSMIAFPDRVESALSPQLSALFHVSDTVSLYANASQSFRAPTLNELYRGFRVGNVLTLANENLKAERADNVEGGVRFGHKLTNLKTSVFWTRINRAVANVTLMSTPSLITRQRQNAGRTRSRGFEVEAETRWRQLHLTAGYLFADSRVTEFPANVPLVGALIPQVARHQFTAQMDYSPGRWTLAMQGRGSSKQFDDDLNQFVLEPYAQLDFFAARRVGETLKVYVGIENVLNSRYSVGKTPVRTLNSPVSLRLGVRWN